MKLKFLSLRNVSAIFWIAMLFVAFGVVHPVYAADFGAAFNPQKDAVVQDAATDIVVSFNRPIYVDAEGTAFTEVTLANIVSLRSTDANGSAIAFTATVNTENTGITINPTENLVDGTVYVAVSNAYYDGSGAQGDAAETTFLVSIGDTNEGGDGSEGTDTSTSTNDNQETTSTQTPQTQNPPTQTTALPETQEQKTVSVSNPITSPDEPTVTISPADGEVITDSAQNITLTFSETVYRDRGGSAFTASDLASFVVLRTDDVYGYGIPFEATMNANSTVITVNPLDDLYDGDVYISISADYYDADVMRGTQAKVIFTVDAGNPPPLPPLIAELFATFLEPTSSKPDTIIKNSASAQTVEELKKIKIREALTLLWEALEALTVAAAIEDMAENTSKGSNESDNGEGTVSPVTTEKTDNEEREAALSPITNNPNGTPPAQQSQTGNTPTETSSTQTPLDPIVVE